MGRGVGVVPRSGRVTGRSPRRSGLGARRWGRRLPLLARRVRGGVVPHLAFQGSVHTYRRAPSDDLQRPGYPETPHDPSGGEATTTMSAAIMSARRNPTGRAPAPVIL